MSANNNLTLIGNLCADMEMKYLPDGTPCGSMSLAVNFQKKQGEEWVSDADFFNMDWISKRVESLKPYLLKGQPVAIQGELKQRRWTDDAGNNHSIVKVKVLDLKLLNKRDPNSAGGEPHKAPEAAAGPARAPRGPSPDIDPRQPPITPADTFEDDIPFN